MSVGGSVPALLPCLGLCGLSRELVSGSTSIKERLLLGVVLVEHISFLFTFLQESSFLAQKQVFRELVIPYVAPAAF